MSDWTWWQNALAGDFGPVHEGTPQQGFYKVREGRGGPFVPVAIWQAEDGSWLCKRGKKSASAEDIWTFACRHPITHDVYTAVMAGAEWPDAAPAAAEIGHNLPTDPAERFKMLIEIDRERIDEFVKTPISDEASAVKAGTWSGKMKDLAKEIDDTRTALKKPHDDAGKAVQSTFKPLVDDADALAKKLATHVSAWVLDKKRKADAEAAEAARIRREAELAAARDLDLPPPPEPTRAQARAPSKIVTGGVTARTVKVTRINDLPKAAAYIAGLETPNPDFVDVVRKISHRLLTAGISVPGATLEDSTTVS